MLHDRVNLKLLHAFLRVAEYGSFREAAEDAHRSQSAMSAQIKTLEEQLGIALFHRTTHRVRLTEEGEQLVEAARRAVHEIELGLQRIAEAVDLQSGRVAISCSPTIAATRLPPVLAMFERDYPRIRMLVQELTSAALFETVRRQTVDFGIGPVTWMSEFAFDPILTEELYALAPKAMLDVPGPDIKLSDLARTPILLLNAATALRSLVEEALGQLGLRLMPKYEFSQAQSLIVAAEVGLGSAILPKSVLPARLHRSVRALRIIEPTMTRQIAIITLKGQSLPPAAARLAELLRLHIDAPPRSAQTKRAVAALSGNSGKSTGSLRLSGK
ncbi:MAG: LysR family transcriptional regulator [Acetobacteraceae bacterium]